MSQMDTLPQANADQRLDANAEQHENYLRLVWQRFKKSTVAIVGGLMVLTLCILAVFADFFSPHDPYTLAMAESFTPPQSVHFFDEEGNFHLRPFTYRQTLAVDAKTFETNWTNDTSKRYEIQFFVRSWEYKLFGLFPTDLHLFGVEEGGTIYLLGTEKLGRDLWGPEPV